MRVAGIQRLSLVDYPGVVACTLFTPGCNMRCPYCHNSGLIYEKCYVDPMPFLKARRGILDGVCVSGGEPTLQDGIAEFLSDVRGMGYLVKLDTNGTRPVVLSECLPFVDYVAMDLKLPLERYGEFGADPSAIEESIGMLGSWREDWELRTTVADGVLSEEDIASMSEVAKVAPRWVLQKYVGSESVLDPSGLSAWDDDRMLSAISGNMEIRGI